MARAPKKVVPKHHQIVKEAKQKRKRQRQKDYRPDESYPTVEEAKRLIRNSLEARGYYEIKSIRNTDRGFAVGFEREIVGVDIVTDKAHYRGKGPYGAESVTYCWETIRKLWEKEKDEN